MKKFVTDIKNGLFIKESKLVNKSNGCVTINIENKTITKYLGMGGAITEASAFNYAKLDNKQKRSLINDYYSSKGLNYNFGRVGIGSNDFSLSYYDYANKKNLGDFSINKDKDYIIPLIKDVLKVKHINLIASPWSPPKMYKVLPIYNYGIKLKRKYYELYSEYLIKWLEAYKNEGIDINYISMQNEPYAKQKWESCVYSLNEQNDFIYNYLLPKLDNTKVLLWDHNKEDLYNVYKNLYQDNEKIAGIGFHYYSGPYFDNLKKIREENSNILLFNTESCCGYSPYDELEWVNDAEIYLKDIIGDFNAGCNAYLDWNLFLDEFGGPCHVNNPVKSPIILKNNEVIKTPIYYYLYHISHFIDGEYMIMETTVISNLDVVCFNKNNKCVIIVMNTNERDQEFELNINNEIFNDSVGSHSIVTYIYEK